MKRRSREDIRIQNLVCKVHFWLHVLDGEEGPIEEAVKWVDCRWVAATNDSQALALFCRRGCVLEFRHIQFFHILSHSSSWDGDIHLEKIKNSYAPLKRVLTYKTSNSHWRRSQIKWRKPNFSPVISLVFPINFPRISRRATIFRPWLFL